MAKKRKISPEVEEPSTKTIEINTSGKKKWKQQESSPESALKSETSEKIKTTKTPKKSFEKSTKPSKNSKNGKPDGKLKKSSNKGSNLQEKPEDWNVFKKKKKEVQAKRKQNKDGFDVLAKAKSFADRIQRKSLDPNERNKLVNQLHALMKGKYSKFALAHDSSRIVQIALKYGSNIMRGDISKELMEIVVNMMTSKYARHIVRRMLKHGEPEVRKAVIDGMSGHAVKFASHVVSAPTLEYAYSTWATPLQKQHLLQEFFSDMYRNSKDDKVRHLRDVYESSPDLKAGVLTAVKDNLSRIINKNLFDSGLVQTVLFQYLSECTAEQRAEMISQIVSHIVVISNSRDGSRAAMQCIWHGTNKDRKVAMKALKENIIELCKHEHGHCTVITFLDAADDTVLLHKVLLSEILKSARDLAADEWGRKVLLWLVAPADSLYFHPTFVRELEAGLASATSKKPQEIRRKEILQYASEPLTDLVKKEPEFWLSKPSLAVEMLGIVKAGCGEDLEETYRSIVGVICNSDWQIKDNEQIMSGIEHPGIHMTLKKLAHHDKVRIENNEPTFAACLVEHISDDVMQQWIKCNRGCFLLIAVFENSSSETQESLRTKLVGQAKILKKQNSAGSKILMKKLS